MSTENVSNSGIKELKQSRINWPQIDWLKTYSFVIFRQNVRQGQGNLLEKYIDAYDRFMCGNLLSIFTQKTDRIRPYGKNLLMHLKCNTQCGEMHAELQYCTMSSICRGGAMASQRINNLIHYSAHNVKVISSWWILMSRIVTARNCAIFAALRMSSR